MTAKDAQRRGPAKPLRDVFIPLKDPRSWLLSLYYFLTFGGFVAMAIYLPILLSEIFGLTPQMAGMRTAGFVLLATMSRPIGGALADRVGGKKILTFVFPFTAVMAILLAASTLPFFTVGALGGRRHRPWQWRRLQIGSGVFPHVGRQCDGCGGRRRWLGRVLSTTSPRSHWSTNGLFHLRICSALRVLYGVLAGSLASPGKSSNHPSAGTKLEATGLACAKGSDTTLATTWGLIATAALIGGIYIGSRGLRDFDPALVSYAGATLFAAFGLGYRFSMWLRRPPTRLYWYRGWQIFLERGRLGKNLVYLLRFF